MMFLSACHITLRILLQCNLLSCRVLSEVGYNYCPCTHGFFKLATILPAYFRLLLGQALFLAYIIIISCTHCLGHSVCQTHVTPLPPLLPSPPLRQHPPPPHPPTPHVPPSSQSSSPRYFMFSLSQEMIVWPPDNGGQSQTLGAPVMLALSLSLSLSLSRCRLYPGRTGRGRGPTDTQSGKPAADFPAGQPTAARDSNSPTDDVKHPVSADQSRSLLRRALLLGTMPAVPSGLKGIGITYYSPHFV